MNKRLIVLSLIVIVMLSLIVSVANAEGTTEKECTKNGFAFRLKAWAEVSYDVFTKPDGLLELRWTTIRNSGAYLDGITVFVRTASSSANAWLSKNNTVLTISGHVVYSTGFNTPFGFVQLRGDKIETRCDHDSTKA